MTASQPRRRLFDFPSTTSFLFFPFIRFIFWAILIFGGILLIFQKPAYVSGEVFLEPDLLKNGDDLLSRVPRELIQIDRERDHYSGYNNPTVIEGNGESGRSAGGDAYETLRQMSLASTQPFIKRRLFNTSVALTVPLFSFTLPQRAAEGSTVDLANQAIFGLFALLTTMMVFAVPVLFTGIRPFDVYGRSMQEDSNQDILDNLIKNSNPSNTINIMGTDLQNKIGLNPDECLKKTICDAHKSPKKYGLFALPFQMFYPPPSPETTDSRTIDPYQQAAQMGEFTNHECWEMYNCFFDIMDLAVYFRDWVSPPPDTEDDEGSNSANMG